MNHLNNTPMKNQTRITLLSLCISALFLGFMGTPAFAQDEQEETKKLARPAFESAILLDNQTVVVPIKNTLEWDMQHRFSPVGNGIEDLFGIYGPGANIRLGFSYTLIDNLGIGFGYTKTNGKLLLDGNVKYAILKQTRDWSMPVSVTYFGNFALDTRSDDNDELFAEYAHRMSFFHEVIIASRITPKISLQIAPSFSHFNAVSDSLENDIIALSFAGRYKFSPQSSVIFEYTQQLTDHDKSTFDLQPGISIGMEVATSSHAFQFFVSTFSGIVYQENIVFNQNKFDSDGILIGFNITRLWNF